MPRHLCTGACRSLGIPIMHTASQHHVTSYGDVTLSNGMQTVLCSLHTLNSNSSCDHHSCCCADDATELPHQHCQKASSRTFYTYITYHVSLNDMSCNPGQSHNPTTGCSRVMKQQFNRCEQQSKHTQCNCCNNSASGNRII